MFKGIALAILKPLLQTWLQNRALKLSITTRVALMKKFPQLNDQVFDAIESVTVASALRELDQIKI